MKRIAASLARFELWIVGGAVFASVAYERLLPYFLGLGAFFWLLRWIATGHPTLRTPLNLPLLFLLLTAIVSMAATPLIETTTLEVMRLVAGILLFFSLVNSAGILRNRGILIAGMLVFGVLLATSSFFLVDWIDKFHFLPSLLPYSISGVLGNSVHPNVMAGMLILFIAGAFCWLIFTWGQAGTGQRAVLIAAIVYMSAILFLTQSRGGLLALTGAVLLAILLRFRRGWILVGLTLGLGAILFFAVGPQIIFNALGTETGGATTVDSRAEIWMRASLAIQDYPLSGIGMGTFTAVVDKLYPIPPELAYVDHAHNLFLQIALDLGLPGLVAWLAGWLAVLRMAWQLYRQNEPFLKSMGAVFLCSQAALGLHGLFDCVTWDTRPSVVVWGIWGIVYVFWTQKDA